MSAEAPSGSGDGPAAKGDSRLESWGEIAAYLRRSVRAVQRWEKELGLPVRRRPHAKRDTVWALRSEIDDWGRQREIAGRLPETLDEARPMGPRRVLWLSVGAGTLVLLAAASFATRQASSMASRPVSLSPRPLASERESEAYPSLSPDGRYVAYVWSKQGARGVYVKSAAGGAPRPLALADPRGIASFPRWSPDGRSIAFLREVRPAIWDVHVVPAEGGASRALTEISSAALSWTGDGNALAVADRPGTGEPYSVFLVSRTTGERLRRVTAPAAASFGDWHCAISPDGTRLAVARYRSEFDADVFVTTLDAGEASMRRLTRDATAIRGLDWTADGSAIVFASARTGRTSLWQVSADGEPGEPRLVLGGEGVAESPSLSRGTGDQPLRLAYMKRRDAVDVWRWDLGGSPSAKPKVIATSFRNEHPAWSPDGRRVAFVSNRSASPEIWTADADGANQRRVTFTQGLLVASPRWAPDGRWIAFTGITAGNLDIYRVRADGASLTRLTTDPTDERNPSWSRDGRWIYFRSNRSGLPQIWRMASSQSEKPVLVTRGEGSEAVESVDGRTLYFVRGTHTWGLWQMPTSGGPEKEIIPGLHVWEGFWDVVPGGIMFLERDIPSRREPARVKLFRADTGRMHEVGNLEVPFSQIQRGLGASPDGLSLMWTQSNSSFSSDLMIVDGLGPGGLRE